MACESPRIDGPGAGIELLLLTPARAAGPKPGRAGRLPIAGRIATCRGVGDDCQMKPGRCETPGPVMVAAGLAANQIIVGWLANRQNGSNLKCSVAPVMTEVVVAAGVVELDSCGRLSGWKRNRQEPQWQGQRQSGCGELPARRRRLVMRYFPVMNCGDCDCLLLWRQSIWRRNGDCRKRGVIN